jgi:trimeric autotransporter adhesin
MRTQTLPFRLAVRRALFLALAFALTAGVPASAAAGHRVVVLGTVSAVDATAGNLAVTPRHPNHAAAITLQTNAQTALTLDGAPVKLADVPVGSEARAAYNSATKVAMRVDTISPHPLGAVQGTATAVTDSSITIAPQHGGAPVTLDTNASTEILLDGATSTLSAIAAGDQASALFDSSTKVAIVIEAQAPHHAFTAVEGQVTAVAASSITIAPEGGGAAVTLDTNSSTRVFLNGSPSTLSAIATGDQAGALYDSSTMLATLIQALSPHTVPQEVEGQVTAVAAASITIAPQGGGADVTLGTDAATQIFVNGAPANLSAIATGDSARALYDGTALIAQVIQAQAPHHQLAAVIGQVTALTSASLTITPPHGSAVTITTNATTEIFLDGAPVNLSALAAGDQAQALYDTGTQVAVIIAAEAPHQQIAQVEGKVTAVAAASVTITPEGPGGSSPVTLTTTSSTQIYLNGKTAPLTALAVGDPARALYETSTLTALAIEAVAAPHQ